MSNARQRWVAAVGDVEDINCWSGIPFHFLAAARCVGFAQRACRLDMAQFSAQRRWWNAGQLLRGRAPGGFQYSESFLAATEAAVLPARIDGDVITFHQHFPRTATVHAAGGRLFHYLDATFASACREGGWAERLPRDVQERARASERENLQRSDLVVTMARWAAQSVIEDCGVASEKVRTILPGANLELDTEAPTSSRAAAAPLVLGFIGKDWQRKGLPFLLAVRRELDALGLRAVVRAAGHCPPELQREAGLEFVGFIDKAKEPQRFVEFLRGCDLGCLFSAREPLGISTLEFLRAGVPVAGFAIEGMADTLPPDAGFRFAPTATAHEVADAIAETFRAEGRLDYLKAGARAWAPRVTWERCVSEWAALLANPSAPLDTVRPWEGMHRSV
jgi:glycosyltransferase involved in cell wall biosynthesis